MRGEVVHEKGVSIQFSAANRKYPSSPSGHFVSIEALSEEVKRKTPLERSVLRLGAKDSNLYKLIQSLLLIFP
jgi:hypothetical protein